MTILVDHLSRLRYVVGDKLLLQAQIPGCFRLTEAVYCTKWPPMPSTYFEIDGQFRGTDPLLVYYERDDKTYLIGFLPGTFGENFFTFKQVSHNPETIRSVVIIQPEDMFYFVEWNKAFTEMEIDDMDLAQSIRDFWFVMAVGGWFFVGAAELDHCRDLILERKMRWNNKEWRGRFLFAFHCIVRSFTWMSEDCADWFLICYVGLGKIQLDDMCTEELVQRIEHNVNHAMQCAKNYSIAKEDVLNGLPAVVVSTIKFELPKFADSAHCHLVNMFRYVRRSRGEEEIL